MKYLLITNEYPPDIGGVGHYYSHMAAEFEDNIIVLHDSGRSSEPGVLRRPLITSAIPIWNWLSALPKLLRFIKQEKPNRILVGQILPYGSIVWLASFFAGFEYAVFIHGFDYNNTRNNRLKRLLADAILGKAYKIICANSKSAAQIKQSTLTKNLAKIQVVNPGVNANDYTYNEAAVKNLRQRHKLVKKTVVLSIGRLVRRKGFDTLIDSFKIAKREVPALALVIIGDGPYKQQLSEQIKRLGLDDDVLILSNVDNEEKNNWLGLCDIFALIARQEGADMEGFGIVYLEANLAGKPVIAGRSGGVADAVVDDRTGLLVDPYRPEPTADAIIRLAKYPGLRQRLGDEGRQRAIADFNWQKQANRIKAFLDKK